MGQREIIAWLSANPGWHKTTDIVTGVGKGQSSVYNSARALAKHGEIQKRSCGHSAKCGLEWSA
jgi:hypothetical protein